MRQFLKFTLASIVGFLIAGVLLFFVGILFVVIAASAGGSSSSSAKKIAANSVLKLDFKDPIPERTNNLEMNPFDFGNSKIYGLQEVLEGIRGAASDDKIKGIYIEQVNDQMGLATVSSIRSALMDFKKSGKFVIAYNQDYSKNAYYLATVADSVYLNPFGGVDFRGTGVVMGFFQDMLNRVGVEIQVFYAGQFKSATEPLRRNDMSEQSKLQMRAFLTAYYDQYLQDIAAARNLPKDSLAAQSDRFAIRRAEDALSYKLVDQLVYKDQVLDVIRAKAGLEKGKEIPVVSLADYLSNRSSGNNFSSKNKVAVVYAEGTIVNGKGDIGEIGDEKYTRILRKIREDESIKALVLRVNSGGGSSTASENILREVQLFKATGRPVIVSMGDYAASGGYYFAAQADTIMAEPLTLTGSIGVFSLFPNAQRLFNEKLGIHFDTVQVGRFANSFTPVIALNDAESAYLQSSAELYYDKFLDRVATGRNMTKEAVHEIAQGRVWTGKKAVENGLVDRIGSLDQAIAAAAKMAKIQDDYRTKSYPEVKEPLQLLMEELTGQTDQAKQTAMKSAMGDLYPLYKNVQQFKDPKGVYAMLPFFMLKSN